MPKYFGHSSLANANIHIKEFSSAMKERRFSNEAHSDVRFQKKRKYE